MLPTVPCTDCFVFNSKANVHFNFTNVFILLFCRWERGHCAGLNWNSVWSVGAGCANLCCLSGRQLLDTDWGSK